MLMPLRPLSPEQFHSFLSDITYYFNTRLFHPVLCLHVLNDYQAIWKINIPKCMPESPLSYTVTLHANIPVSISQVAGAIPDRESD